MRNLRGALCLACAIALCAGCASAPKKAEPTTATAAKHGSGAGGPCPQFAAELCAALGNDTETCMSLRNVVQWLPERACKAAEADIDTVLARVTELRKACDTLAKSLCAEIGEDSSACADVKQDMPRVPAGHCATLLSHRDEIVAQVRARAEHDKPLPDDAWAELLAGAPPSAGAPTAKVTLVEFSDFQCPYCAQAGETVKRIREKYGETVRIVFRQFPLSFHEHARIAAQASLAAHAQGKFWPLHDLLFENQSELDRESLVGYATQLGLDAAKFKASLDDAAVGAQIDADLALGRKAQVDGTPTLFVNKQRAENPTDFDDVAALIDAALAQ